MASDVERNVARTHVNSEETIVFMFILVAIIYLGGGGYLHLKSTQKKLQYNGCFVYKGTQLQ